MDSKTNEQKRLSRLTKANEAKLRTTNMGHEALKLARRDALKFSGGTNLVCDNHQ
jgi:hypothetical protein